MLSFLCIRNCTNIKRNIPCIITFVVNLTSKLCPIHFMLESRKKLNLCQYWKKKYGYLFAVGSFLRHGDTFTIHMQRIVCLPKQTFFPVRLNEILKKIPMIWPIFVTKNSNLCLKTAWVMTFESIRIYLKLPRLLNNI